MVVTIFGTTPRAALVTVELDWGVGTDEMGNSVGQSTFHICRFSAIDGHLVASACGVQKERFSTASYHTK